MVLSTEAMKNFYLSLKKGTFYLDAKKDVHYSYKKYLLRNKSSARDETELFNNAVLHTVYFEYEDAKDLMISCEVVKVYIIMAITCFLIEMHCPKSLMPQEMRDELALILKDGKIKKHKKFFSTEDYKQLVIDEKDVLNWYDE